MYEKQSWMSSIRLKSYDANAKIKDAEMQELARKKGLDHHGNLKYTNVLINTQAGTDLTITLGGPSIRAICFGCFILQMRGLIMP